MENFPMINKLTPKNIYALTVFIYILPVLFLFFNDDGYMVKFVSGYKLSNPVIVFLIISLIAIALYFISGLSTVSNIRIPSCGSEKIWWVIFCIYTMMAFASAGILVVALDLITLIDYLINDQLKFVIMQPTIGVTLSESGLLKFFMISYLLSYLWMLFFIKIGTNSNTKKLFFIITFVLIGIFYFLLTRRELLMYHFANMIIGFLSFKNIKKLFTVALVCIGIMIYSVMLRMGDVDYDGGLIGSYFRSEEFYPFQFSAYLIDKWTEDPYFKNFFEITPLVVFFNQSTTISPNLMAAIFNYYGPGPTAGIFYSVLSYGIIYPVLYFYLLVKTLWYFYEKCKNDINGWVYYPFYTFIILKLFLLVRNGEFVNNFIDLFIFSVLCVPFMVFRVRRFDER